MQHIRLIWLSSVTHKYHPDFLITFFHIACHQWRHKLDYTQTSKGKTDYTQTLAREKLLSTQM